VRSAPTPLPGPAPPRSFRVAARLRPARGLRTETAQLPSGWAGRRRARAGERLACWLLRRRILRRQGRQARGRLRRLPGPAGAIRAPFGRHAPRPPWLGSSAQDPSGPRTGAGRVPSCGTLCLKAAGRLGAARAADCLGLHPALKHLAHPQAPCARVGARPGQLSPAGRRLGLPRPKEAIGPNPGDPSRRAVTLHRDSDGTGRTRNRVVDASGPTVFDGTFRGELCAPTVAVNPSEPGWTRARPGPPAPEPRIADGAAAPTRIGQRLVPVSRLCTGSAPGTALNLNPACQGGTRARATSTPPPNRRGGCSARLQLRPPPLRPPPGLPRPAPPRWESGAAPGRARPAPGPGPSPPGPDGLVRPGLDPPRISGAGAGRLRQKRAGRCGAGSGPGPPCL
jgi:hypothetical protein